MRKVGGGESEIVSECMWESVWETGKRMEKGIITDSKEDGGEGTSLFNPSVDVERDARIGGENREGGNIVEEAFEGVTEPERHTYMLKKGDYVGMVNGIESFSSVEE